MSPDEPIYAAPEDVEQAFYEAVAQGDADRLGALWAEDEETQCVHPTGVRLSGMAAIRESWRSIFATARIRVQVEAVSHWLGSVLAIHHLAETLFVGDDPSPHGPLHVTHVYARGAHGWRLVCRHASAADDSHQAMADGVPHTLH
jgi:ketosteroid isomerase-like protein